MMLTFTAVKDFLRNLILGSTMALAFTAAAEPFRVHGIGMLHLDGPFDKKSVQVSVNDGVAIKLPEDTTFLQGIEINIKVPKEVAEWRDSVAWSLYSSISPVPSENRIDYNGVRTETGTFDSLSLNLLVPLEKNNTIKKDAYSHLAEYIADKKNGCIFLRFQLVMKGTSDSLLNSKFTVAAKPILIEKGIISVKAQAPDGSKPEPYTVFVDGNQADIGEEGLLVDSGTHNISLVSDHYRNELRAVTVEQAKNTVVDIIFRDIRPIIRLAAPEKTTIFFDDTEYKAPVEPFYTTQGEHTVRFIVGDYEIVRTVTTSDGRSYNIAVSLDALINEIQD
ncbi:MAG: hypothetical protein KBS64_03315 [Treponema sp.]|nr:hypothetical protein [Candidatus Treponema equi]